MKLIHPDNYKSNINRIVTIVCFFACIPLAFEMLRELSKGNYQILIFLFVPAVGIYTYIMQLIESRRRSKYAFVNVYSDHQLEIGKELNFRCKGLPAGTELFAQLLCQQIVKSSCHGEHRVSTENVWAVGQMISTSGDTQFSFLVPSELPKSRRDLKWKLVLSAELPGVDYLGEFPLTLGKSPGLEVSYEAAVEHLGDRYYEPPAFSGPRGLELSVVPGSRITLSQAPILISQTKFWLIVNGLFFAGSYIVYLFIGIIVVWIMLIFVFPTFLHTTFSRSKVEAHPGALKLTQFILGYPKEHVFYADRIKAIIARISGQSSSSTTSISHYSLEVIAETPEGIVGEEMISGITRSQAASLLEEFWKIYDLPKNRAIEDRGSGSGKYELGLILEE